MKRLSELPNIGKTMEKRLAAVGINDVETFMKKEAKKHLLGCVCLRATPVLALFAGWRAQYKVFAGIT